MIKKYLLSLCMLLTGLVLTAQPECDCEFDFDPVCVVDETGETIALPNACLAECLGFSAEDFVECGDLGGGGETDCECDFDIFEPVCVADEDGYELFFPNACIAECEGFSAEDFVDCGDLGGGGETDCECGFEFEPVCIADEDGNIIPFPNACIAECEGFSAEDFVDCGDLGGGGGTDCECDFDIFEPVCVADEDGYELFFPNACIAECEGYGAEDFVDCGDLGGGGGYDCECDFDIFDPVCIIDEFGDIIPFPNACFAECFGYTTEDITDCGDLGGGGGYDCECDFEVFDPVCVVDEWGDIIPFQNACFAECCGFTEEDFTDCGEIDCGGGEYEECECDFEFDPVCVVDEFGDIFTLPNACFAECLGYSAEDFVDCGDTGGEGPDCECDWEFEPVCVVDEFGDIVPFPNACLAECFGYSTEDFVDCGDTGGEGGGNECDCDFEILEPVCITDDLGNTLFFPNACFAECEGFEAEDFGDCGDIGGEGPDCECGWEFEPVCVVDELGETVPFPNACLAECYGYTAEDFVDCGDLGGGEEPECDCGFEYDPVCVVDESGELITLPNACLAECIGFSAEDFVDCDGGLTNDSTEEAIYSERHHTSIGTNGIGSQQRPALSPTLSASPNPTTDFVNLSWKSTEEGTYAWQLVDLNGKLIQRGTGYAYGQQEVLKVDLSNLPVGIYLIRLQSQTGGETIKVTKS